MNPQLMAMLNGMYGGIPSDTNGIMPLGSGFAGQQLPQDTQPQMQPAQGLPQMPLGSGMYGMGPEAAPQGDFALGSGLYGQSATQPQQGLPQPSTQPSAPQQGASADGMDKFSQLMNNPMFQYGMGLVGAMHTTNPWGGGMTAFLQAQGQQAKIKQANAAAAAEQQRILLAQQKQAMEQRQYEEAAPQREATLGATNASTGLVAAQTSAVPSEMAARAATTNLANAQAAIVPSEEGLRNAQAANLTQEAQINSQKFNIMLAQAPVQMSIYQKINWAMQHLGESGGVAPPAQGAQPAAPSGMQQQSAPADGATGKFGTPVSLLDGIRHVESGGNPNAVNPESGATGAYQFMPATVDMLHKQGMQFDPRDPQQSRDAADYYFQQLLNQNGGDQNKALAAYGGFKTKDPSGYINKVMTAAGQSAPQQAAPATATPTNGMTPSQGTPAQGASDPLFWGQLGVGMGAAGMPGAEQAVQYGKMLSPEQRNAGAYTYKPGTGEMTFNRSPYTEAELGIKGQELNIKGQENTRAAQKQQYEIGSPGSAGGTAPGPSASGAAPAASSGGALPQAALDAINKDRYVTANTEIQKSFDANKELPTQITAIRRAQADLAGGVYAGTTGDYKKWAAKAYTDTFGRPPDPKVVNSEDFNSAMAQLWMKSVKTVDQNPTERQMNSIKDSFGSLANDPAALKNILHETEGIFTASAQRHNRAVQQYETKMGPDPYSRYIAVPEADTPRPAAASASIAAPTGKLAPPKAGEVRGNFVFLGGDRDPADPKSWAPKPKGK